MRIEKTQYIIASRSFPLVFENQLSEFESTDRIEHALKYDSYESAEENLSQFDHGEDYQILQLDVEYLL